MYRFRLAAAAVVTAALATTVNVSSAVAECRTACNGSLPSADVLARVHTAGRVTKDGRYTWPGVYFEGRFRGTGVGIALNDSVNDYDVQIDGTTVATLVTASATGTTTTRRWTGSGATGTSPCTTTD